MDVTWDARLSSTRAATWGLVLAAPAALFLTANILNELGIGFLYALIDPLLLGSTSHRLFNIVSPLVFLGGIGIALLLNFLAIVRCDLRFEPRRLVGTLTIEPRAQNVALILGAGLMLAFLAAYAFVENYAVVKTHL